jgi:hypothetical protein
MHVYEAACKRVASGSPRGIEGGRQGRSANWSGSAHFSPALRPVSGIRALLIEESLAEGSNISAHPSMKSRLGSLKIIWERLCLEAVIYHQR